jgi:hypothetical protein
LRELEIETKIKDDEQQKSIDFLLDLIHKKTDEEKFDDQINKIHDLIEQLGKSGQVQAVEVKRPEKKGSGPIITQA